MSTAVARKPPGSTKSLPVGDQGTLEAMLKGEAMQNAMADVLPVHVTPKRMLKLALVAFSREPKLWRCTQASTCQALIASSELGLDCSGTTGKAYIIPFGNIATFVPGYRGLIELATRGGDVIFMEARAVYEGEGFEVEYGLTPRLFHRPIVTGERGALVAAYSVATMKNDVKSFDVMSRLDIDRIKDRSPAGRSGPWITDYAEMARKTPVRRHCKYLPCTPELEAALAILNELDKGPSGDSIIDQVLPELEATTATERLAKQVAPEPPAKEPGAKAKDAPTTLDRADCEHRVWTAEAALRNQAGALEAVLESFEIPNFKAGSLRGMDASQLQQMVGSLEATVRLMEEVKETAPPAKAPEAKAKDAKPPKPSREDYKAKLWKAYHEIKDADPEALDQILGEIGLSGVLTDPDIAKWGDDKLAINAMAFEKREKKVNK